MRARLISALTFCLALFSLTALAQDSLTFTPISQTLFCWTETECIAVQGNYAYISDYWIGLHILDVTDPQQPVDVGWYHSPDRIYDVAVSGDFVYLATSDGYVRIVDVGDPSQPVEVSSVHLNDVVVWSVTVSGNLAYAGGNYRVYIIDVSDPTTPTLLSAAHATYYVHGLALSGDYLYAACSGWGLRVYDVSNPVAPVLVGICHTPGYAYSPVVQGDRLYVANDTQGLSVLDISNPTTPVILGSLDMPGNCISLDLLGNYAYLASNHYGVYVMDISDPAAITQVGFYSAPSSDHFINDLDLSSGYVYLAVYLEGFRALSTADPTNPYEVGAYSNYGLLHAGLKNGNYLYLLDYNQNQGLRVIDVSDPAAPAQISTLSLVSDPDNIALVGGYLYLALGYPSGGIAVVDITDPAAPTVVTTLPIASGKMVAQGNLVYLTISGVLSIYDATNPLQPSFLGSVVPSGPMIMDVAVEGDYAYIATDAGLSVVDVSNPLQPFETDYIECHWKCDIHAVGVYDYVAYMGACNLGMFSVDVSDPQYLDAIGWYQDSWIDDVTFSPDGRYLFSATYWQGTIGIDISDPTHPQLAGSYPTLWESIWVTVENDMLYIASGYYLDICQYVAPTDAGMSAAPKTAASPAAFEVTPNPFNPSTAIRYQLSADSYVSLRIYDVAGRLLMEPVHGWRDAGVHQLTFDGSGLPSGIYFVRLEVGGCTQVQKMVLMK